MQFLYHFRKSNQIRTKKQVQVHGKNFNDKSHGFHSTSNYKYNEYSLAAPCCSCIVLLNQVIDQSLISDKNIPTTTIVPKWKHINNRNSKNYCDFGITTITFEKQKYEKKMIKRIQDRSLYVY